MNERGIRMICVICGAENDDRSSFCMQCGAELPAGNAEPFEPGQAVYAEQPAYSPDPAYASQSAYEAPVAYATSPEQVEGGNRPSRKTLIAIIAAIVAVIIVIAGIAGFLFWKHQDEVKHATHPVGIALVTPGYTDAATRIPVSITGTDVDGKSVDEVAFVGSDGTGIELMQGNYEFTFPASPLMPDAHFYNVPAGSISVAIGENDSSSSVSYPDGGNAAVFTEANLIDVTQEQIDQAVKYADMDEQSRAKVPSLNGALVAERERLIQEEERRAEAERLKAQYHVSTQYYEFDIPEYWYGKVAWSTDSKGTTTVFPLSAPSCELIRLVAAPQSEEGVGGDIGTGNIYHVNGSNGKRIELWGSNWAWRVFFDANSKYQSIKATKAQQEELVDLSTGGSMTYSQAVASDPSTRGYKFYESTIVPTVKAK